MTRRNSDERSWPSPRDIKNMVSKMSLTALKTSPTSVDSSSRTKAHAQSEHDIRSPSNRGETSSVWRKRFAKDMISKGEAKSTDLFGIAEETPVLPADVSMTKEPSARKAISISKRRGYRPLSVKVGDAFSPFSSRGSKPDIVEQRQGIDEPIRDDFREPRKGLELAQKVNWSENLDPHIFNANFVATLTSKCKSICVDMCCQLTELSSSRYQRSSSFQSRSVFGTQRRAFAAVLHPVDERTSMPKV